MFTDKGVVYEQVDLNFKRLLLIFLPVYLRSRIPCMQAVTHGPFHTAKSAAIWKKVIAAFRLNFFKHEPGVCVAMLSRFVHQCCVNGVKCNSVKFVQILQTTTPTDFNTFYCCFSVPM